MSNAQTRPAPISIDEYLDGETRTDIKHEYLAGEVVAMGGASAKHGLVSGALHAAMLPHARRKGCQLFIADMKLRVDHADQTYFYYPDLLLACDPQDREPDYRRNPAVKRVVLYGSRAMGNYRPGSDIDLCLFAPAMTLPELLRLGVDIDELLLPWKVDLCLWHQLDNPGLREHIERVGRDLTIKRPPRA